MHLLQKVAANRKPATKLPHQKLKLNCEKLCENEIIKNERS